VLEFPPIVKLLEKADRWQAALDNSVVANRAALARQEGTSTNRVCQVLRLLQLPPGLLAALRSLPVGTPKRLVTERALRRVGQASVLAELERRCIAVTLGEYGDRVHAVPARLLRGYLPATIAE
jgi:hypothetical protein